jgi:squalene-hopene/tetraprenyl-beta-curcumene cyclase
VAIERVAVVGAGLAGLAAALELKDLGFVVELFERSRLLGGRATSFEIDGVEVDNGQHVFLACCEEFIAFVHRCGMDKHLRMQDRFDAEIIARDGSAGRLRAGVLPAPFHLLSSFARYPHLTLKDKLRIGRALLSASVTPSLDSARDDTLSTTGSDETFAEWLHRTGQNAETRRAFWEPFFIPALNAPFDRVSSADALFVLRTAFLRDAGAARFGFSQVPLAHIAAAATAQLDAVHTTTAVLAIEPHLSGVTLTLAKGEPATFAAVVLAVPPRNAARILGEPAHYGVANLDAYEPYAIIDVHLWHDAGSIGLDFAAALESPLQWIFEKAPGYLCCSFSAAGEYLNMPTAQLETLAWREAQTLLPAINSANLVRSAVTRNPEATWLPRVGSARTKQATTHPRIAIAGAWTDTGWPDTMESAVRSGKLAVAHVTRTLVSDVKQGGESPQGVSATPFARDTMSFSMAAPPSGGQTHATLIRAVGWLLQAQSTEGWWSGELETNVTMTAEHVLLFRFLGLPIDEFRTGAIAHILHHQRSDGSWALYYDGPADLSTTIEAYVALKVLGVDPDREEMRKALAVILRAGGVVNARVFTKIWLALFGKYPWSGVPSLPPEMVNFPLWMPFNLYDFACWARGTVAPLTIVVSRKPVRDLGVDIGEIVVPGTEEQLGEVRGSGWLMLVEKLQKFFERFPAPRFREKAQQRMAQWIVDRQEADGSWGGIQPPWVYSLIALDLMGYGLDHPVMFKGIDGMKRFVLDGRDGWRFQACMSPVWDTAWAVRALAVAGFDRSHPAMQRAVRWLLREQIPDDAPGDWRMKCGERRGNGWAFEFDNDAYPDIDDTTIVVLALLEGGDRDAVANAVERARRWTVAMHSRNGAWAAFDRDNTRELLYRMPFSDFGAMIDPPTEDVTAHVVEMLAALGYDARNRYVARGLAYLRATQRPWGSWYGRWGVNHVYGTWCVISALTALYPRKMAQAEAHVDGMLDRATSWLIAVQNPDGGWGETCHSYKDESFAGIGRSTPSQTAWAVLSLQLAGLAQHSATQRGLSYLCERQLPDGTWAEPECTGTGFPGDFYINYHLYRHIFPTMALAMAARFPQTESSPDGEQLVLSEVEGSEVEGEDDPAVHLKEATP